MSDSATSDTELVVEGALRGGEGPVVACALVVSVAYVALALSLVWIVENEVRIPWITSFVEPAELKRLVRAVPAPVGGMLLAIPWIALAVFAAAFFMPRSGRVELRRDGILFSKDASPFEVAWSDVAGFRDDASGYVRILHARERDPFRAFTIPTRTEADRTAVLALLEKHGVRREGP